MLHKFNIYIYISSDYNSPNPRSKSHSNKKDVEWCAIRREEERAGVENVDGIVG